MHQIFSLLVFFQQILFTTLFREREAKFAKTKIVDYCVYLRSGLRMRVRGSTRLFDKKNLSQELRDKIA
jgi:hypothetical protein